LTVKLNVLPRQSTGPGRNLLLDSKWKEIQIPSATITNIIAPPGSSSKLTESRPQLELYAENI
jgi:hypothetical protein